METVNIKRYSLSFKQTVVREYEAGASLTSLCKKYGIANITIKRWIEKFGRYGIRHKLMVIQTPEECTRQHELEMENAALKEALAAVELDKLMLTACLQVAEKKYGIDVKKTKEQILSKRRKLRQANR